MSELLEDVLTPVAKLVEKLRNTSGSNDKIKLLRENAVMPHLQEIIKWTYDPFMKFGFSKKLIEKLDAYGADFYIHENWEDFVELIEN